MAEQSRPDPAVATESGPGDEDEVLRRTADDLFSDAPEAFSAKATPATAAPDTDEDDDDLPPFTEQVAQQLGGVRGLIESGIPVGVFVLTNVIWDDALRWAIGAAVASALLIAVGRAVRKQPIRHAVNGLVGVGIGAYMAWNSGKEEDFYWFGIFQGLAYSLVLMGSAVVRHPLVGWFWSVIANGGKSDWREDRRLVRVFGWLTLLWGVVFLAKNLFRGYLALAEMPDALGVVTLVMGYPVTALLFLITLWTVRRTHPGLSLSAAPKDSAK